MDWYGLCVDWSLFVKLGGCAGKLYALPYLRMNSRRHNGQGSSAITIADKEGVPHTSRIGLARCTAWWGSIAEFQNLLIDPFGIGKTE
jgi:hypothetical protein